MHMRKMLYAMMMALILMVDHTAYAQEWWIGLRGGPSIPHLSDGGNEVSKGYSSIVAPNFGLMVEYYFTHNVSVQFEVDYSGQGGERDGLQPITQSPEGLPPLPEGQYLYADFKDKSVLNYLEIPIIGKYQFDLYDHWHPFIEAGPYIGFLLNATEKTSGTSQIYVDHNRTPLTIDGQPVPPVSFDADTNVKGDLNEVNAGIMAGGGIAYVINSLNQIFIDIRGEYGLRSVQKNTARDGSSNTGCAVFLVGYKYKIR